MISSVVPLNIQLFLKPNRKELLTEVFKKTVIETAVTTVIFTATAIFVASGSGMILLAASAASAVLFNALVRIIAAELVYQNTLNPTKEKKLIIEALNYIAPCTFGALTSGTSDVLIHETGHALAASAFFKNASPSVHIDPFKGGYTKFFISGLTELGKKIGFRNADIAVTAAGAGLALTVSAVAITSSFALQDSYPELSKYLFFSSIFNIANHAFYALSALWTPLTETGHDFVYLSLHGISPILCTIGIISIPIVIKAAFVAGYHLHKTVFPSSNAVAA